jgi:hypothetical protein
MLVECCTGRRVRIFGIDAKNRAFREGDTDAVGEGLGVRYGDDERSQYKMLESSGAESFSLGPGVGTGPGLIYIVWFGVALVQMRHHPMTPINDR